MNLAGAELWVEGAALGGARLIAAGVLVTALALALGTLLARHAATARVAVWRAAVLALLCVPAASSLLPWSWSVPAGAAVQWLAERPVVNGGGGGESGEAVAWAGFGGQEQVTARGAAPFDAEAPVTGDAAPRYLPRLTRQHLVPALLLIWAVVALTLITRLGAGLVSLGVVARGARDVNATLLPLLPPDVRASLPGLMILRGGAFRVPVCWGIGRPTVLLPAASEAWPLERTRAVLLHEAVHATRRDALYLALVRAACALHWINPLVWVLERRLAFDVEMASDQAVVRAGVPAREYARALVDVAAEARRARVPRAALGLQDAGTLSRRIAGILDARTPVPHRPALSGLLGALLLGVALAGATATVGAGGVAEAAEGVAAAPATAISGKTGAWGGDVVASGVRESSTEPASLEPPIPAPTPERHASVGVDVNDRLTSLAGAVGSDAAEEPAPQALEFELPAITRRSPVRSAVVLEATALTPRSSLERVLASLEAITPPPLRTKEAPAWKPGTPWEFYQETGLRVRPCSNDPLTVLCVVSPFGETVPAHVFIDGTLLPWGLDVLVEHGVAAYASVDLSRVTVSGVTIRALTHESLIARER